MERWLLKCPTDSRYPERMNNSGMSAPPTANRSFWEGKRKAFSLGRDSQKWVRVGAASYTRDLRSSTKERVWYLGPFGNALLHVYLKNKTYVRLIFAEASLHVGYSQHYFETPKLLIVHE